MSSSGYVGDRPRLYAANMADSNDDGSTFDHLGWAKAADYAELYERIAVGPRYLGGAPSVAEAEISRRLAEATIAGTAASEKSSKVLIKLTWALVVLTVALVVLTVVLLVKDTGGSESACGSSTLPAVCEATTTT